MKYHFTATHKNSFLAPTAMRGEFLMISGSSLALPYAPPAVHSPRAVRTYFSDEPRALMGVRQGGRFTEAGGVAQTFTYAVTIPPSLEDALYQALHSDHPFSTVSPEFTVERPTNALVLELLGGRLESIGESPVCLANFAKRTGGKVSPAAPKSALRELYGSPKKGVESVNAAVADFFRINDIPFVSYRNAAPFAGRSRYPHDQTHALAQLVARYQMQHYLREQVLLNEERVHALAQRTYRRAA